MSNISPKLIDVENNRIGDYNENRPITIHKKNNVYMLSEKIIPSNKTGRFPTQLFTNVNNNQFKYVKNIQM